MATAVYPSRVGQRQRMAGLYSYDELPHVYNPDQGFLVSANHRVEPEGYSYYLSDGYTLVIGLSKLKIYYRSTRRSPWKTWI